LKTLQIGMESLSERAGGVSRFYYDLLHHLPRCAVTVRGLVIGSSQASLGPEQEIREFASLTAPLPVRWYGLRKELRGMLAEQRADLVAAHFAPYAFPVLDMLRSHPLVVHFHGPWALESRYEGDWPPKVWVKGFLERAVYRRGARCIVLSCAFRDVLHRSYGVPLERISVVPGATNVDLFATNLSRREAREQLGWPQDRAVVLAVRRLVRRMGLEDLISAIKEVRKRVPEALLLIAGKGTLHAELSAMIRSLGLEENVRLLGFVADRVLPLAYRAADLTVVPTVALEGFGLVAVESLAAGTPVLVTPVGGLPEVVRDLSPDLVLPAAGANPLSEGLVAALAGGLILPSAETCQAYARDRYDWSVAAARVRDVYLEALS
jgi:glycogen(starch) synthase